MKLILNRVYLPNSTVGALYFQDGQELKFCSFTMELAWRDNARSVSCIPEGSYQAVYERHSKFGDVYRDYNKRVAWLVTSNRT